MSSLTTFSATLATVLLALCGPARAACEDGYCRNYPRDLAVTRSFTLTVPCPATGDVGHRCPGFIRDHLIPLCAGGADAVSNIWWDDAARAAEKDRHELQLCHRLRVIERHGDDPGLRQRAMALYLRDVEAMGGGPASRRHRLPPQLAAPHTVASWQFLGLPSSPRC